MTLVALVGNQNCGKTTLFNALTGSNQHVGNFPGVTVEKKIGKAIDDDSIEIVDLPGIYSLSPYTPEEVVTRDFILNENPDVILNIIDATNLERNLYLTTQLASLDRPMILALNMMDEVQQSGTVINMAALSEQLDMPVLPVVAYKKQGIHELVKAVAKIAAEPRLQCYTHEERRLHFPAGPVEQGVHIIAEIVNDHAHKQGIPSHFVAEKIIEGELAYRESLALHESDWHLIEHVRENMEQEAAMDGEAALADMRYTYIESLMHLAVQKKEATGAQKRSEKIDKVLTHPIWGIPAFLCFMLFTFWMSFAVIGGPLQGVMEDFVTLASNGMDKALTQMKVAHWLHDLIINGAMVGVGSVLSFLPIILVLFFFLSILEDSGYMARVSFLMDKSLRKVGLSGRSLAPMLIGFGCSVPAVMATRTLASDRDRKMTMFLIPFMSCSAKLPVYGMLTAIFFARHQALVMTSLYVLGILVAILVGVFLKKTYFRGEPVPFVMELPAYRLPSPYAVWRNMWDKAKDFIERAFTIIFLASLFIWFLQNFNSSLQMVELAEESMLAGLGGVIGQLFSPLGFSDWRAASAIITGLTAKEAVLSTLSILTGADSEMALQLALQGMFTPLSAYSFLVFVLLYMPCVATFAAVRRELGSLSQAILMMAAQTGIAYFVAFIVYRVGLLVI